jgi:hypothetical protein
VQVKLPDGELVKQFVSVPRGQPHFKVVLKSSEAMVPGRSNDEVPPADSHFAGLLVPGVAAGIGRGLAFGLLPSIWGLPNRGANKGNWPGQSRVIHAARSSSLQVSRLHGRFDEIFWLSLETGPEDYLARFIRSTAHNRLRDRDSVSLTYEVEDDLPQSVVYFAPHRLSSELRDQRAFVLIRDPFTRARFLVSVPDDSHGDVARIRIRPENEKRRSRLHVSVEVADPKLDSLLQFMNGGDLSSAIDLIEDSVELLYAKFQNPFAAAAAGYVLIHAAPGTLRVPWQQWIGNLGHYFDHLPDGDVLHATLLLQRGDSSRWREAHAEGSLDYFPEDEKVRLSLAADLILRSLSKGPPLFRPGLQLLASNLRILLSSSAFARKSLKQALIEAEKIVTWLSMRVDPDEPFTVFRLG